MYSIASIVLSTLSDFLDNYLFIPTLGALVACAYSPTLLRINGQVGGGVSTLHYQQSHCSYFQLVQSLDFLLLPIDWVLSGYLVQTK